MPSSTVHKAMPLFTRYFPLQQRVLYALHQGVVVGTSSYSRRRRCLSLVTIPLSSWSMSKRGVSTRTFQYGYGNNKSHSSDVNDDKKNITPLLTKLKPRQSAELEDELFSRLNNSSNSKSDSGLLLDPILKRTISRKGLDWIRSISVPSSSSSFGFDNGANGGDNGGDSIEVSIQPPTLLHPKLQDIASNVASLVQEEVVKFIQNNPQRAEWFPGEVSPADIGVNIKFSPRAPTTSQSSLSSQSSMNSKDIVNKGNKALQNITHFLAVYSCKGGVGKSTIAANLAYQLSSMGGRVGLLDLDVYGPSLPLLVKPDDATVRQSPPSVGEGMVEPIEHKGVKLMSLGYVSPKSGVPGSGPEGGAAVLRGPMATRVVSQLLRGTNWGDLDILVLDMPPGTGDVQLEVCQSLSLSGAVAVSTPSALAWADARKGVQMFGEMGVPTLALVENMAYFVCEGGGRHYPFGKAALESIEEEEKGSSSSSSSLASHFLPASSHIFHLPISSSVNDANERGSPLCCNTGSSTNISAHAEEEKELVAATFSKLADAVSTDMLLLQHGRTPLSTRKGINVGDGNNNTAVSTVMVEEAGESVVFDVPFTQLVVDNESKNFTVRLFSDQGGYQKVISGSELRIRDPRTGEKDEALSLKDFDNMTKISTHSGCGGGGASQKKDLSSMVQHHTANNDSSSSSNPTEEEGDSKLFPAKITKKGNYGYEVEWADGATIIYSLVAISKAAGGKPIITNDSETGD